MTRVEVAVLLPSTEHASAMKRYQVHTFDMGHVNATEFIEALDDADAVEQAKLLFVDCEREVWAKDRFVARLMDNFKS